MCLPFSVADVSRQHLKASRRFFTFTMKIYKMMKKIPNYIKSVYFHQSKVKTKSDHLGFHSRNLYVYFYHVVYYFFFFLFLLTFLRLYSFFPRIRRQKIIIIKPLLSGLSVIRICRTFKGKENLFKKSELKLQCSTV